MKKNSKGFTLIELLAVIVILAIIALIATPIILNIIKKVRVGAAQSSAYSLRDTAKLYFSTELMLDPDSEGATFECKKEYEADSKDGKYCVKQVLTTPSGGGDATLAVPSDKANYEYLQLDGTNPTKALIKIDLNGNITITGDSTADSKVEYNNGAFECTVPSTGKVTCNSK